MRTNGEKRDMKIKWTEEDLKALRCEEFMRGLSQLPYKTLEKVRRALCATSSMVDFIDTFNRERIKGRK